MAWAAETSSTDPCNPARRLTVIRGFLRHLSGLDGTTDVPPPGLLGSTGHRKPPHVYSDAEIAELLAAASGLAGRLRPYCYKTLFALMACTGMRIGETLALCCGDVDLSAGVITVRFSKRGRTRLVPLHPSAVAPLRDYVTRRAGLYGKPGRADAFFRTDRSARIAYNSASSTFERLSVRLGWTAQNRTRAPRIHDLRHRMVVRRIQAWHAEGANVEAKIPALATYLGHAEIANLYWYLSAVPELMSIVADRFETYAGQQPGGRS
ncbi:tyrosine-type recombinase/integrase [Arthrobacter sp. SO3]|uniref:tyrosine-type recombinase/integrase n=1 Tax=Arthrobacter sp. SO3 TaxID=1897057 RepID=UPI001CFF5D1A|nr:tyrosine-type recombinase/integrase [Arthrobacter sp. SO3]